MKTNFPVLASFVISVLTIAFGLYIWNSQLPLNEKVSHSIQLAAVAGSLVSATFVIYSYLLTNRAFVLSQKPHLLVGLTTNGSVFYQNRSENPFEDLELTIVLNSGEKIYDIGKKLFANPLYMASHDQRQIDLETVFKKYFQKDFSDITGNSTVTLGYQFTFQGKREQITALSYQWIKNKKEWEIACG